MSDAYPPPNVTPPGNTAYPPPNVQPPQGAPGYVNSTSASSPSLVSAASGAILHHESGSTPTHLVNYPANRAGATGPGQIIPSTFKQYALPGENINNPADNLAVHNRIMADYARRWPNDPARWAVAYQSGPGNVSPPGSPFPWKRNISDGNNTVSQYVANTVGKIGQYGGGGGATSAPSAPTSTPAPAVQQAQQQPFNMGAALGALTGQSQGGGQQQQMGGGGEEQAQPMDMRQGEMAAAAGNARQQMLMGQGAQLAAALRQQAGQPLTWGPRPYGSNAGPQMEPGTTLNSMGA